MPLDYDYARFLESFASAKFHHLWPVQSHTLAVYASKFSMGNDIAVELPTGSGKTLIALLIAETWRRDNKKVAILSANKTLARQLQQEALALGIPAVLMEGRGIDIPAADKRAYHRAAKVAIMNYWVYFNQNPVIDPADLLIMDDAHLAEHCLHSLYSVEITRYAHEVLFENLVTELSARFPEYTVLADALATDVPSSSSTELLSFIDQVAIADRIREIVDASPYLTSDTDLAFRWNRLRQRLQEANIYLNLNSIWIRPYIYPLLANQHYAQSQQRLYLSATIGDPGDLSRRLGVRPITKVEVPTEYTEKTVGRRLVVINRIEDTDLPERLRVVILAALRIHPKSVWLCSSEAEARRFRLAVGEWLNTQGLVGHPTWMLTALGDEIDTFKKSPRGHLFVAGRFDGMDFKADECRLVVITTLPRAINTQEEFISAYLRDSGFMKRRLNQRIVQALGRCNRSDEDYGVYVLADRRFATHFGPESSRVGVPHNIVAELDMAQDMAEIEETTLVQRVDEFLGGQFVPHDTHLQGYREDIPTHMASVAIEDTSEKEVVGWTALFDSQNYEVAAHRFEECWDVTRAANLIETGAFHGWQLAKALYLQAERNEPAARAKALNVLDEAITRGGHSAWFNRMRASLNRARGKVTLYGDAGRAEYAESIIRAFDDLLERHGTKGERFEKRCSALTTQLESTKHSEYQQGLMFLGHILGYQAAQPKYATATDCRWRGVFGNFKEVITFEAKIENDPSKQIDPTDIGQAHNQLTRAETEYVSYGYRVRGTIVTHLKSLTAEAEASAGSIKVLEKEAILALWHLARMLLSRYRDGWSLHDLQARLTAAQIIYTGVPEAGWFSRALDTDTRFISQKILCKEWRES